MNEGDRVRIVTDDKSNADSSKYNGQEGVYAGIWKNWHGEECPDVSYPLVVNIDGVGERCFRRGEVEPLPQHSSKGDAKP